MTLTGDAVNQLFYSDMTQKVNNAYTHADDKYGYLFKGEGVVVNIVHGA